MSRGKKRRKKKKREENKKERKGLDFQIKMAVLDQRNDSRIESKKEIVIASGIRLAKTRRLKLKNKDAYSEKRKFHSVIKKDLKSLQSIRMPFVLVHLFAFSPDFPARCNYPGKLGY